MREGLLVGIYFFTILILATLLWVYLGIEVTIIMLLSAIFTETLTK